MRRKGEGRNKRETEKNKTLYERERQRSRIFSSLGVAQHVCKNGRFVFTVVSSAINRIEVRRRLFALDEEEKRLADSNGERGTFREIRVLKSPTADYILRIHPEKSTPHRALPPLSPPSLLPPSLFVTPSSLARNFSRYAQHSHTKFAAFIARSC